MVPNDRVAQLINKLSYLMKNHEKLRNMVKQNIKDKLDLGLIRMDDQQIYDQSSEEEQIQQIQVIEKKQKKEIKNDIKSQIGEKNVSRKQLRKNIQKDICNDQTVKFPQFLDIQNSPTQRDSKIVEVNISQPLNQIQTEVIIQEVQEDNEIQDNKIQAKNIRKRTQNQQLQKETCNICNRVFKSIITLTYHLQMTHKISFKQQELPLLKKYVKF